MDGFKQRLVGALVLISLAVIFVPMLLDEPHEERATRTIEIPQEPDFPEVRIEPVEPPEFDDPIATVPKPDAPPLSTGREQSEVPVEPMSAERRVPSPDRTQQSGPSAAGSAAQQAESEARDAAQAQSSETPPPARATGEPEAVPSQPAPQQQASTPAAGGYLVQLGSFSSQSNAAGLKDSVTTAGFSAHTVAVESDGKTFTRVFAGPFPDKDAAASAKQEIDSKFGLNSLVIVND
ncbi:MAG: sporulation protein [Alteromonadaceae bacterium]|nr:sporulation protein [Alteromonadaceae bacterium]